MKPSMNGGAGNAALCSLSLRERVGVRVLGGRFVSSVLKEALNKARISVIDAPKLSNEKTLTPSSPEGRGLFQGFLNIACLAFALLFFLAPFQAAQAKERHSDPDGCFSCHGLPDLEYIDKNGVLRVATILQKDYYGSLHGSVPCKDCHRKIERYPHKPEEGYVNCSESCHVNEPSKDKAFTHKPVVEEFRKSAHGSGHAPGTTKDFHGGNRLEEEKDQQNPSCRRCHSNTPYIRAENQEKFKEEFHHADVECGNCHQGETWRNQFSGHILRRLSGSHFSKAEINALCDDCHADAALMEKVEREDTYTKEKKPVDYRWIHASDSYDKSLHGRLIEDGSIQGASCLDCHAIGGNRHKIKRDEDLAASTHPDNLPGTCGQSGCHGYAKKPLNDGFVTTDMHNVDWLRFDRLLLLLRERRLDSNWFKAFGLLGPMAAAFLLGALTWTFRRERKGTIAALIGAERFQRVIIGSKPNKAGKKRQGIWPRFIDRLKSFSAKTPPPFAAPAKLEPKQAPAKPSVQPETGAIPPETPKPAPSAADDERSAP
jgi:sulfite reductase (NADPH) flavoprotein alpha-component